MEKDINIIEPLFKDKDAIVIQYLESSMSNELLCKFPDNSGFGFDYSQSSIWSPLVPRFHSLGCLNPQSLGSSKKRKRLSFDEVSCSSSFKKKVCTFGLNLNAKLLQKKKMNMKTLKCNNDNDNDNDNTSQIQSPPSRKGWKKVLKMNSKHFKRKKDNYGHRHPISRVTLADYLKSQDF